MHPMDRCFVVPSARDGVLMGLLLAASFGSNAAGCWS